MDKLRTTITQQTGQKKFFAIPYMFAISQLPKNLNFRPLGPIMRLVYIYASIHAQNYTNFLLRDKSTRHAAPYIYTSQKPSTTASLSIGLPKTAQTHLALEEGQEANYPEEVGGGLDSIGVQ